MKWIAAVGGGAFVLASLAVGVRLLLLAWRTRALPETAMGLGLFLMGGFAYPLTSVARQAVALSDEVRTGLMIVAHVFMVVGVSSMGTFNWRVFRPESRVAGAAAGAIALALLGCFVAQGISPGYQAGALAKEGVSIVVINVLSGFAMAWAAIESLRYAGLMRRRESLGLASGAVTRRVLHWGTASACATIISFYTVGLHALGLDPAASAAGALVIGPFGLVAAVSLSLAFLRRRGGRPAAAGEAAPT